MAVKWIKKTEEKGSATIYPNYLLTNREFVDKFQDKYSVLVGLDDDSREIVLKPLSIDEDGDPKYRDALRVKINIQRSFIRFGNTKSMKQIASSIELDDIPKDGIKGTSKWDELSESLYITLGGKK